MPHVFLSNLVSNLVFQFYILDSISFSCQGPGSIDFKVASMSDLVDSSFDALPLLLYPRLFALHNILDADQSRYFPPALRLAHESIEPLGIYLIGI